MSGKTILDFGRDSDITGDEVLYAVDGNTDVNLSVNDIKDFVLEHLPEAPDVPQPEPKPYEIHTVSPNLFDKTKVINNQYLNSSNGKLVTATGWSTSEPIAVVPGEKITISYTAKRIGTAFFTSKEDMLNAVPVLYVTDTALSTLTVPENAYWMISNINSSTITAINVQIEHGSIATPYKEFGETTQIDASYLTNIVPNISSKFSVSELNLTILAKMGNIPVEIKFTKNSAVSGILNFAEEKVNGIVQRTPTDDAAPVRMDNTTIGGNHGYAKSVLTANAHGKTVVDIGSVWSCNGVEYVIISIDTTNALSVTARYDNSTPPSGTYTHVSGGVNKTAFTSTARNGGQWYSPIRDRRLSCYVDDVLIDLSVVDIYDYKHNVRLCETYNIMQKTDIVEWLIANPGIVHKNYDAIPALTVNYTYVYDIEGGCTVYYEAIGRKSNVTLRNIMVVQSSALNTTNGVVYTYIPKTKEFTLGEAVYNLQLKEDLNSKSFGTPMYIRADNTEEGATPPDRIISLNDQVGYALGYLPILDAAPENRVVNATNAYLEMRDGTLKQYPRLFDSLDIATINEGDTYKTIAYRKYFMRSLNRTTDYVVRSTQGDFLYLDWHNVNKIDEIALPSDLVGKTFIIVESSSNVQLLSTFASNNILVKVDNTKPYGYLVLKFI